MRKVGVEEWLLKVVQAMYRHAKSKVRVGDTYSEAFDIRVGVHQGSVLSPLLFIIVLEAISREFWNTFWKNSFQSFKQSSGISEARDKQPICAYVQWF
uniref:Uncharacterized protein n=1 Tax=Acanthochromis polyacanthus TaxID=80966 RepID=A0A3Q1EIF3_9TELE